ncbi:MAG: RNA polymerase subunit sigma-70, partial [Pseudomonadota bacterium]|nr:RNA polymerase subunit sigma-70 [Pseudomonadota bacterium]
MTIETGIPENDRDLLAAEYVLRLLDDASRAEARDMLAADPAFADAVARWEIRLASLLDTVTGVQPPVALWPRIRERLGVADKPESNVVRFEPRAKIWKGYSAAMTAIAAALAVALVLDTDA